MKITHYSKIEPKSYSGDNVKEVKGRVAIGKADGAQNFCMRVFELSQEGYTPRHSHEWEHEIFFHNGKGQVFCDNKWIDVEKGSIAFIPGNEEHQIRNNGTQTLVFVCLIPSGVPEL